MRAVKKALITAVMTVALTAVPVMADETAEVSRAGVLQDSLTGDYINDVMSMIDALDVNTSTQEEVDEARRAYDSLTMGQRVMVENYDKLLSIEESLGKASKETTDQRSEDSKAQKNATDYNFRISSYKKQLSVKIRLIVDSDGDGEMDMPEISISSPSGKTYEISDHEQRIDNDECDIEIIRTTGFIQINVIKATDGIWSVKSSKRAVFELEDYEPNGAEEFKETDDTEKDNVSNTAKKGTSPLILLLIPIGFALFYFGSKRFFGSSNKKTAPEKRPQINAREDDESLEDDIAKIREEWMNSHIYDDEVQNEEEDRQTAVEDINIAQTVEDLEDDGIEEIENDGFYMKPRFGKTR